MANVQVITQQIYYAVKEDLSYAEYESAVKAQDNNDVKYIIQKNIGHNPFETNAGSIINNYAAELIILDHRANKLDKIQLNDWSFSFNGFGFEYGYSYTTMWVKYIDKFGYWATEKFTITIDGFLDSFRRFNELIKYDGYKFADMSIKYNNLKIENESLKNQIDSLSQEYNRLKAMLSQSA